MMNALRTAHTAQYDLMIFGWIYFSIVKQTHINVDTSVLHPSKQFIVRINCYWCIQLAGIFTAIARSVDSIECKHVTRIGANDAFITAINHDTRHIFNASSNVVEFANINNHYIA